MIPASWLITATMLHDYQLEVDKGKLTAVANFKKLTFRALASTSSEQSKFTQAGKSEFSVFLGVCLMPLISFVVEVLAALLVA